MTLSMLVAGLMKANELIEVEAKDYSIINATYGAYSDVRDDVFIEYINAKKEFTGISVNRNGEFKDTATSEPLKLYSYKDGTLKIWRDQKDQYKAARLVCELFVKVPEDLMNNSPILSYIDGNKSNIKASNLAWRNKNNAQNRHTTTLLVTDPDGNEETYFSIVSCAKAIGILKQYLYNRFKKDDSDIGKIITLENGTTIKKIK